MAEWNKGYTGYEQEHINTQMSDTLECNHTHTENEHQMPELVNTSIVEPRVNEEDFDHMFQKINEVLELLLTANQDYSEGVSTAIRMLEEEPRTNILSTILSFLTLSTSDCKHIRFTEAMDVLHSLNRSAGQNMTKALEEACCALRRLPKSEVKAVIEKIKRVIEKFSKKQEAEKTHYGTSGKRGLLCFLQYTEKNWAIGNQKDKDVLKRFFEDTLEFDVKEYSTYSDLDKNIKKDYDLSSKQYYCLVICISGHGTERGVITGQKISKSDEGEKISQKHIYKSIGDIKERFGNKEIPTLAGVPKVIILDACRGIKLNKTVSNENLSEIAKSPNGNKIAKKNVPLSTTDSDCVIINATTHGHVSRIPEEGSVGIQGVMKALNANWKNDHLEEMLIDAREEVAKYRARSEDGEEIRQTLETQSTLTKRLVFVKSSKKTQDVSQSKSTEGKE